MPEKFQASSLKPYEFKVNFLGGAIEIRAQTVNTGTSPTLARNNTF